MKLNVKNDFMDVCDDFHVSATLKVSGSSDVRLNRCVLNEPVQWKELEATGAQVLRQGTLFAWPKSRSTQPPVGAVIVDSGGTYWTIWQVVYKQHVQVYEAKCLNLSIVTAVANTATVLKATYTHGMTGQAKATWKGLWSGVEGGIAADTVAARFQPSDETARLEFGSEWRKQTYRVFFDSPVPVDVAGGDFRLVDSSGYRYRVMQYHNEERIDRLPVAIAVRINEGTEYHHRSGQ